MFAIAVLVSPSPSVIVAVSVIRLRRQQRRRSARLVGIRRIVVDNRPHLVERHNAGRRSTLTVNTIVAAGVPPDTTAANAELDRNSVTVSTRPVAPH